VLRPSTRIFTSLVAGALLAVAPLGVVAPTPALAADTRPCVSLTEFGQVTKGMTKLRVHSIFDTSGRTLFANHGQVGNEGREYVVCGRPRSGGSYVQLQFDNYRWGGGPMRLSIKRLHLS
jgi:hypothetical protein